MKEACLVYPRVTLGTRLRALNGQLAHPPEATQKRPPVSSGDSMGDLSGGEKGASAASNSRSHSSASVAISVFVERPKCFGLDRNEDWNNKDCRTADRLGCSLREKALPLKESL